MNETEELYEITKMLKKNEVKKPKENDISYQHAKKKETIISNNYREPEYEITNNKAMQFLSDLILHRQLPNTSRKLNFSCIA